MNEIERILDECAETVPYWKERYFIEREELLISNAEIERLKAEISRLREQLRLKDQILKSVAQQGIEQQRLIIELCDAIPIQFMTPELDRIVNRAREATK
jgi:hypothetical protein